MSETVGHETQGECCPYNNFLLKMLCLQRVVVMCVWVGVVVSWLLLFSESSLDKVKVALSIYASAQ